MNFTGEPAPRAAKSSAIVSARAMATLSHSPQALQRRKRR
jgi:hypothetical protein